MENSEENIIEIYRGDIASFILTVPLSSTENYEFQTGDKIQFRVFEKKGYDKNVLLEKEIEILSDTEEVEINLSPEETTIGDPINKTTTYWYGIDLNNEQTLIGFTDENGAAEFRLLQAKGVGNNA